MLTTSDGTLSNLAEGQPSLVDAETGIPTGLRLRRKLGTGGMSTVFLATCEHRGPDLAPHTPDLVALKILQPDTLKALQKIGVDAMDFIRKEVMALGRVREAAPTPHVVDFYGSGTLDVTTPSRPMRLPWLAIEYVSNEGGGGPMEDMTRGTTLPGERLIELIDGLTRGVAALHRVGVIHRDLKPANVLVEVVNSKFVPKLSDCGIARLAGMHVGTLAAASVQYAGFEQLCSVEGEANPLIGPWTDVHAVGAVVWFLLAGEDWYDRASQLAQVSTAWMFGDRPSLAHGAYLHPAVRQSPSLLTSLDAVLRCASSARLPMGLSIPQQGAGSLYRQSESQLIGPPRYPSIEAFAAELRPLLDALLGMGNHAPSRPYLRSPAEISDGTAPTGLVGQTAPFEIIPAPTWCRGTAQNRPAFAPIGAAKALMCVARTIVYYADKDARAVAVLPDYLDTLSSVRWIGLAGSTYVLVGPGRGLVLQKGKMRFLDMPARASGVGPVVATAIVADRVYVATDGCAASFGEPELWESTDFETWSPPTPLDELNGQVTALAICGSQLLVAGKSRNGKKGRIAWFNATGRLDSVPVDIGPIYSAHGFDDSARVSGDGFCAKLSRESFDVTPTDHALLSWMRTERGREFAHTSDLLLEATPRGLRELYRHTGAPLAGFYAMEAAVVLADATGARAVVRP